MKISLVGVPILAAGFLSCDGLHAQELIPGTYNPWTASGSAQPAQRPVALLGEVFIGPTNGTNSVGSWDLSATGLSQIQLIGGAVNIGTRAQTAVSAVNQSLSFQVDSFANAGPLDLDGLLGAGVAMSWQADLIFADFNWAAPGYELDFLLTAPAGLLSNVADLADTLQVSVLDGANNLVYSIGGGDLIDLLGITIGNPVNNGPLNAAFSSAGAQADGLTVRFEATSLVNTSLLGIGSNVATFSGVSLTAVPEPGVPMLAGLAALTLAARRRRDRI